LPAAYREHVADLPAVVERLETHAAAARARLDELNALVAIGGSPPAEIMSARDHAKRELADSVAALEAVRLDLLRLHGGATDLKPITTVLEAARGLGEELDRLVHAQSDVRRLVQLDLRPTTPA
jgi:serine/threonine-protein kinase